jgi:hypothetical protein
LAVSIGMVTTCAHVPVLHIMASTVIKAVLIILLLPEFFNAVVLN